MKTVEEILVEYQKKCTGVPGDFDKFPDITDTFADAIRDASGSTDHTVRAYTVKELLSSPAIKHNQSRLSTFLKISRGTLRKYMEEDDFSRHAVLYLGGTYTFMAASHGAAS